MSIREVGWMCVEWNLRNRYGYEIKMIRMVREMNRCGFFEVQAIRVDG